MFTTRRDIDGERERERDPRVRSLKVSEPLLNCSVVFSDRPGGWDACCDAGTLLAHTMVNIQEGSSSFKKYTTCYAEICILKKNIVVVGGK